MRNFFLLFTLILFGYISLFSQEKELILVTADYGVYCDHDVYIDTSGIKNIYNVYETRQRLYSKDGYYLITSKDVYIQQCDSAGIPLAEQIVTLDNISPEYYDEFSDYFSKLKSKFGNFMMRYKPQLNAKGEVLGKMISIRLTFDSLLRGVDFLDYTENELKFNGWSWIDFEPHFPISVSSKISTQLFPNPTSTKTTLNLSEELNGKIIAVDLLGNEIQLWSGFASAGDLTLDLSKLQRGSYSLIIDYGSHREAIKLIKE